MGRHSCTHNMTTFDYAGGNASFLGGDNIGHCEEEVRVNMYLILNGYQERERERHSLATEISGPNSVRFEFVGLEKGRSLQNKGGHTRRIARSHFGCCFQHEEM